MGTSSESLKAARLAVESTPDAEKRSTQYAARLNNLAVLCQAQSQFVEADLRYKESVAIWEQVLGAQHSRVAQSLSNRASLYRLMYELHEAERIYQLALDIWYRQGFPPASEMTQVELSDDVPLWAEQIDGMGVTRQFRTRVQELRQRVESGAEGASGELVKILDRLGAWYHNLNFGGIETVQHDPDYPARRWRILEPFVPQDLSGKTVLDIGCNAGFFSLEMKKRGAARVVATDFMAHLVGQVRFASYWFDLPIEPRLVDVYDIESLKTQFDYVVFVGVLYHLKHPLYALEKVANVCKDTLLFQSLSRGPGGDFTAEQNYSWDDFEFFKTPNYPKLYFIEKSFNSDESNWWMATESCLKAMLRVSGFKQIQDTLEADHLICRKTSAL